VKCVRNSLIFFGLALGLHAAESAQDLARAAERAEKRGDKLQAFLYYARAAALDPSNSEYQIRRNTIEASDGFIDTKAADPDERETDRILRESGQKIDITLIAPPALKGSAEKKSFNLRGDTRRLIEEVATAYGIQVVFEADYQPQQNVTFRISDASFAEAFRALELVSNSFFVPVNERMALVARDTPQKRAELVPAMTITIPIPERMTVQDAQEIVTAVQQTMEIRRVSIDSGKRTVTLRDAVSKVLAARALFEQLSKIRAQVEVEVEVLAVSKNSSLTYGLDYQSSTNIVNLSNVFGNNPTAVAGGFTKFLTFGAGKTLMGMGVADATLIAALSKTQATSLIKSDVVAVDGQPVSFHVGDRYPIVTNQYIGATGTGNAQVYVPPPTITFEDLGLVLKVTPTIHGGGEVTLDISAEYKLLGAGSSNNIPVVSNRKFEGKVRLAQGQWGVIAGLEQETVGKSYTGLAGLSDIPLFGKWLRKNTNADNSAQLVILVKPYLMNLPPWEDPHPELWVGTDSRPLSVF
jgi:type II secretory pathway component GspD/PulD (secretin)